MYIKKIFGRLKEPLYNRRPLNLCTRYNTTSIKEHLGMCFAQLFRLNRLLLGQLTTFARSGNRVFGLANFRDQAPSTCNTNTGLQV